MSVQAQRGSGFDRIPRWITSGAQSGFTPQARMQQVQVATTIGTIVGLAFAVFNLLTPDMRVLGLIELCTVMGLGLPALYLSRFARYVGTAETLLLLAAIVIFSALIVHGGVESTGLFWVYTTPFLAFFLKGQRLGALYSVGFLLATAIYLLAVAPTLPTAQQYTQVFSIHFLLALAYYTLVAAAFDAVRQYYDNQLRKAKDSAESANLEKSRFLAAASHDLRQPAHALGLFVARLQQMPMEPRTAQVAAGVGSCARALHEMLDLFFDYARLEAGSVVCGPLALGNMLAQLEILFQGTASQKGLRLIVRPTQAYVRSDSVLLQRVLLNLVGNALQYTDSGTVLVACRPAHGGTHIRIEVRDSGIGIAPQFHQKIFDEYFQVENPLRERIKGLGLGLSMVRRSCELLAHPLQLRSALGCGTCFSVTVPLAAASAAAIPPDARNASGQPARTAPENSLQGLQVLLIDDDALVRHALQGLLQSWGCKVTQAQSAQEAIDAYAALAVGAQPDFVVSDFSLRGTHNGIETIGALRLHFGAPLKACLISADTSDALRQLARQAGLVLLRKPLAPSKLRSLMGRAMADRIFLA